MGMVRAQFSNAKKARVRVTVREDHYFGEANVLAKGKATVGGDR